MSPDTRSVHFGPLETDSNRWSCWGGPEKAGFWGVRAPVSEAPRPVHLSGCPKVRTSFSILPLAVLMAAVTRGSAVNVCHMVFLKLCRPFLKDKKKTSLELIVLLLFLLQSCFHLQT